MKTAVFAPGRTQQIELAAALGDGPIDPAVIGSLIGKYDYEPA